MGPCTSVVSSPQNTLNLHCNARRHFVIPSMTYDIRHTASTSMEPLAPYLHTPALTYCTLSTTRVSSQGLIFACEGEGTACTFRTLDK
jgi:hypothetical protein